MKKTEWIPWQQVRDEVFTIEEQRILDMRTDLRMATRKIKELRRKLGISQTLLAQKAGIPRTTLTKIESGYQNVSILKLMKVADAMDMDLEIQLVKRT